MTCDECGAVIRRGDGRFCSHCGAKLPDVPRITPEEWITHAERFDEAEASTRYERAMEAPAPQVSLFGLVPIVVFLIFWLAIGSFIIGGAGRTGGGMFSVAAVGIVGAGVLMVGSMIVKGVRFSRAPVERALAVVIEERTHVSGGGKDSSATTHYYATLSLRDGSRREVETTGQVAGAITRGDIGVAVLRMNKLVAFHRTDG